MYVTSHLRAIYEPKIDPWLGSLPTLVEADTERDDEEVPTNRLLELHAHQSHKRQTFIARLEAQVNTKDDPETPNNYI